MNDIEVLTAIGKGTYWLKLKKLRALGYIKGRIPKLEITEDGIAHLKELAEQSAPVKEDRPALSDANGLYFCAQHAHEQRVPCPRCTLRCCHGTEGCAGQGDKHWCEVKS